MDGTPEPTEIDGRGVPERELLHRLRDLLAERAERETALTILVGDDATARRVAGFCTMSRLTAAVSRGDGHWRVAASGTPCRCFT